MDLPDNILYTKEHEWVRIEGNSIVIGITDYAQSELGDIVFIEFPEKEEEFSQNEPFGTIEAVKTVSDLFMPVSGSILEINDKLEDQPELINSDSYGDGWIVKVKPRAQNELDTLLSAEDYESLIS